MGRPRQPTAVDCFVYRNKDQPPLALTPAFGSDEAKMKQWAAFLKRGKLGAGGASL